MLEVLSLLAALSGAAEASGAAAAEPAAQPAACTVKLRDFMRSLHLAPETLLAFTPSHLRFRFRLTPMAEGLKPDALRLTLTNADGSKAVYPANRVGAFAVPMSRFTQGGDTLMEFGPRCDGGFAIGAELAVAGRHGKTPDTEAIRVAMDEYDALIKQQGLLVRMFAPKLRTLVVRFPMGVEGYCTGRRGDKAGPYRVNERYELNVSLKDYLQYDSFDCRTAPEEILLSADK